MTVALAATLLLAARNASYDGLGKVTSVLGMIIAAMLIGGLIGAWKARTAEMTGMPELVAMLHSFVGLAAVLVGYNSFFEAAEHGGDVIHAVEVFLGVFIGAVTFTGSIVANLKLSAKMKSAPLCCPRDTCSTWRS